MVHRLSHEEASLPFSRECRYTVLTPDRPTGLVMALHGMGQTPTHMRRRLAAVVDDRRIWCFPEGPYPYEVRRPGRTRIGYAWYLFTGDQEKLRESMLASCEYLLALHSRLCEKYGGLPAVAAGFSQGGYLAGVLAARNTGQFLGAACISGRLKHEFMPHGGGVRLLQLHGGRDENVSADLARKAVADTEAKGYEARYVEDAGAGHEISPAMAGSLGEWLNEVLT